MAYDLSWTLSSSEKAVRFPALLTLQCSMEANLNMPYSSQILPPSHSIADNYLISICSHKEASQLHDYHLFVFLLLTVEENSSSCPCPGPNILGFCLFLPPIDLLKLIPSLSKIFNVSIFSGLLHLLLEFKTHKPSVSTSPTFLAALWHMELPGQRSYLSRNHDLSHNCGNGRSPTYCACWGLNPCPCTHKTWPSPLCHRGHFSFCSHRVSENWTPCPVNAFLFRF